MPSADGLAVITEHKACPRYRRIPHKKTHTRFQTAILLYCTTHNALELCLHRQTQVTITALAKDWMMVDRLQRCQQSLDLI